MNHILLGLFSLCACNLICGQEKEVVSKMVNLLVDKGFTTITITDNRVLFSASINDVKGMLDSIKSSAVQLNVENRIPVALYPNNIYCNTTGEKYWANIEQIGNVTGESLSVYSLHSKALTILPGSYIPGTDAIAQVKAMHKRKLAALFQQQSLLIICIDKDLVLNENWENVKDAFENKDASSLLDYVSLHNKDPQLIPPKKSKNVSSLEQSLRFFTKISFIFSLILVTYPLPFFTIGICAFGSLFYFGNIKIS